MNDFSTISAENGIDRLAQMTPEEHSEVQGFLDDVSATLPDTPSPGDEMNARSWAMLRQIHEEIKSKVEKLWRQDEIWA